MELWCWASTHVCAYFSARDDWRDRSCMHEFSAFVLCLFFCFFRLGLELRCCASFYSLQYIILFFKHGKKIENILNIGRTIQTWWDEMMFNFQIWKSQIGLWISNETTNIFHENYFQYRLHTMMLQEPKATQRQRRRYESQKKKLRECSFEWLCVSVCACFHCGTGAHRTQILLLRLAYEYKCRNVHRTRKPRHCNIVHVKITWINAIHSENLNAVRDE